MGLRLVRDYMLLGGRIFHGLFGGIAYRAARFGPLQVTPTYSPSITPDLADGNDQVITATDGVAFTINAPLFGGVAMSATNPPIATMTWTLTIRNTSGGAAGALTFNAVFKIGAAWTQPATGFSRSIQFRWNGTNHVEVGRTAADVAN